MPDAGDSGSGGISAGGTKRPGGGFLARYMAKRKKRALWMNVTAVCVTAVIVAATLFWLSAFTVYAVSSNSMAPTFRGTRGDRDRVLGWKLAYRFSPLKRWEIAMFTAPANAADRDFLPGWRTGGESGLTIKRVVGLPGETLAIAGGDIWTRPLSGGDFRRQVKPEAVQRSLWIPVYREDFADVNTDEFLYWWQLDDDASAGVLPDRTFLLSGGEAWSGIRFLPLARVGGLGEKIIVLPGIPDRYVLDQEVDFKCQNPECRTEFKVWVDSPKIDGRCPVCGLLNREDAVTLYELRSGLPEIGPYAVGTVGGNQGDSQHFRANSYNFVPDLRVTLEMKLPNASSVCRIILSGDERETTFEVGASGARVNELPVNLGDRIKPGEWIKVEFHTADGAVRAYVGAEAKPVFDRQLWSYNKPAAGIASGTSGIALQTRGGAVAVRNLAIDRDIYYFSGREQGIGNYLNAMDGEDSVDVGAGHFFPLGDNTTVSLDGRSWGAVDMSLLHGRAIRIWSPRARAGWIPEP